MCHRVVMVLTTSLVERWEGLSLSTRDLSICQESVSTGSKFLEVVNRKERKVSLIDSAMADYLPSRNTLVPHTEQVPLVAALPFFKTTFCSFLISLFALHLKQ